MQISPSQFRRAFDRFQAIHTKESGWPLDSFANRESFAFEWEGYKNSIPDRAMAILQPRRWSQATIGKGEILRRVIQAIELPGNNLLQWEGRKGPASRVHLRLLEAKTSPRARRELESCFYDLYKRHRADRAAFETIVSRCGKRYELLGYLCFIADPGRFLPIRTRTFDRVFRELGLDLRTERQCGWDNYQAFLAAIREVQICLQAEGILDASLLDAHSFCWILAQHQRSAAPAPRIAPANIQLFNGTLHPAAPPGEFSPNDETEVRDMRNEADRRQASGQIAEEVALNAERARLRKERRPDLAARVEPVADRPGLGYDIKSLERDGTDRFIEVKNVSNANRFFLSEGQWLNSRARPNYWFYLVSGAGTSRPRIARLSAAKLGREHLQPLEYAVKFSPRP